MTIDLVLFDLDGTLADTAPDLAAAANRQRADLGMEPLPLEELRPLASHGARGLIGRALGLAPGDAGYEASRLQFLAYYEQALSVHTRLFAGMAEALDLLESGGHPKPHPAPLRHALDIAGVAAAQAVYVGDDLRDVQAGRAAGMRTVVAAYGYLGDGPPVEQWGADHVISTPDELLSLLY